MGGLWKDFSSSAGTESFTLGCMENVTFGDDKEITEAHIGYGYTSGRRYRTLYTKTTTGRHSDEHLKA